MCLVYVLPRVDCIDCFIISQYCSSASSTSIFRLCAIIRFLLFKCSSSISASCCLVCIAKHRAWAADIGDLLVKDGARAASTTLDGGNSFSVAEVAVPVVGTCTFVSSSSRSLSIHLKADNVNAMLCTDGHVLFRNGKRIDLIMQLYNTCMHNALALSYLFHNYRHQTYYLSFQFGPE